MADEKIEQDDTEGSGYRFKGVEDGSAPESNDTDGNLARPGRVDAGEPESDDTEGHTARGKA